MILRYINILINNSYQILILHKIRDEFEYTMFFHYSTMLSIDEYNGWIDKEKLTKIRALICEYICFTWHNLQNNYLSKVNTLVNK